MNEARQLKQSSKEEVTFLQDLLKAQMEIKHAVKDSRNPHFKNEYASLTSVIDEVIPVMNRFNIVVTQPLRAENGQAILQTILTHTSGQSMVSECPLLNPKGDMQSLKSALTYARRMSLEAMAGIGEEDDDGEGTRIDAKPVSLDGYIIPFGKFKGSTLGSVGLEALASYADYLTRSAKEQNKPIQGSVKEFLEMVTAYSMQEELKF